jgi:hypothetical protein
MTNMKKLLWSPIDLPKFPNGDKLIEYFDNNNNSKWHAWNIAKLTEVVSDNQGTNPYAKTQLISELHEQFPEIVTWIENLPYKSIRNIKLNRQIKDVSQHCDFTNPNRDLNLWENNNNNEPSGYRVILTGKRQDGLYVVSNNKRIFCNMPEETDTYVLTQTVGSHGVLEDDNRWTLYLHLEIDKNEHEKLLKKSLAKYKEYAIYENL